MLYFVVYAPIMSITLVLVCSGFEIRFTCDEPSNGRKNEVEGLEDREELQKKPNRPNTDDPRQKPADQKCNKRWHLRCVSTRAGRSHHGQPWVFTTACGYGRTTVLPVVPQLRRFSFTTFCLPS